MARAKFKCIGKTGIETFTVSLEPVAMIKNQEEKTPEEANLTSRGGEILHPKADRSFFEGFPNGAIHLTSLTPEAGAQFEVGKEVWVHFTPVVAGE